jgi:transcriptional regulator with XRE-family HTH domain
VKAARELLGWSQKDLAHHSGISEPTIKRLEARNGELGGREGSRFGVVAAFRHAGVEFTNGDQPGVRMRKGEP